MSDIQAAQQKKPLVKMTLEEKKAALEAKLGALHQKKLLLTKKLRGLDKPKIDRKQDARKKILFGVTILEMMEKDPSLKEKVFAELNRVVKKEADRKILGLEPLKMKKL